MKDQIKNMESINFERLLFRRQFLLGTERYTPNHHWSCIRLPRGLYLSIHKDLSFTTTSQKEVTITLVGHAIDPHHPKLTNSDVLQSLIAHSSELKSLIDATYPLVGRWMLILQNDHGTYLFTDPCGLRQIYYHSNGEQVWCASQPEIIRENRTVILNKDIDMMTFLMDQNHARQESAWIGSETIYENCFHLMPNHYLDMDHFEQVRFYTSNYTPCEDTQEIVELSSKILQGTMKALVARHDVTLALTAGWDSRVLLAASKQVCEHIEYYVYRQENMTKNHPDIYIPTRIRRKLGLKFVVKTPDKEIPGWFVSILSRNVTCARILPKTRNIYHKLRTGENRININGNGSEICRNFFDKYCKQDIGDISSTDLASKMFGNKIQSKYVTHELDLWKSSFDHQPIVNWNILDYLYWEQKMGNWGSQFPAEQDIATDEISPFNCRQLIECLLSSPRNLRSAPDFILYKEIIMNMWPEVMQFPVNPLPIWDLIGRLKLKIRTHIPLPVERLLKSLLKK